MGHAAICVLTAAAALSCTALLAIGAEAQRPASPSGFVRVDGDSTSLVAHTAGSGCDQNFYSQGVDWTTVPARGSLTADSCATSCRQNPRCTGFEFDADASGIGLGCVLWLGGACSTPQSIGYQYLPNVATYTVATFVARKPDGRFNCAVHAAALTSVLSAHHHRVAGNCTDAGKISHGAFCSVGCESGMVWVGDSRLKCLYGAFKIAYDQVGTTLRQAGIKNSAACTAAALVHVPLAAIWLPPRSLKRSCAQVAPTPTRIATNT